MVNSAVTYGIYGFLFEKLCLCDVFLSLASCNPRDLRTNLKEKSLKTRELELEPLGTNIRAAC